MEDTPTNLIGRISVPSGTPVILKSTPNSIWSKIEVGGFIERIIGSSIILAYENPIIDRNISLIGMNEFTKGNRRYSLRDFHDYYFRDDSEEETLAKKRIDFDKGLQAGIGEFVILSNDVTRVVAGFIDRITPKEVTLTHQNPNHPYRLTANLSLGKRKFRLTDFKFWETLTTNSGYKR
jgi:hypothetical protein